mmetsp:Transcript_39907/g.78154  ORF Transcript_39907/g.78154 Transcript_39907/m.78154 type:complete len:242 (-) Transcript_39907:614-1339(-)
MILVCTCAHTLDVSDTRLLEDKGCLPKEPSDAFAVNLNTIDEDHNCSCIDKVHRLSHLSSSAHIVPRGAGSDLEALGGFEEALSVDTLEDWQFLDQQEGAVRGVKLARGSIPNIFDPVVIHALKSGGALGRVDRERFPNVVLCSVGDVVPEGGGEGVSTLLDVVEHNRVLCIIERMKTTKHEVKDDSERPDVDLGTVRRVFLLQNLRCDEVGSPAHRLEAGLVVLELGEAKVNNLDDIVLR